MPEELVAISIISIVAGTILTITLARMFFGYLRAKAGVTNKSSNSSLTTSELESMLKRVVQEANEPLLERVEKVERAMNKDTKSLLPKQQNSILDDLPDEPDDLAGVSKRKAGVSKV